MSMIDPKGTQPEMLAKLAEASREEVAISDRNGLEADKNTLAIPTDPALKQDAATKVLQEGVTHRSHGSKAAINRLPDRAARR